MIRRAEAICVGGGNTFALAKKMQEQGLMRAIRNRVKAGVPYVGWSAGSNVACPGDPRRPTTCRSSSRSHFVRWVR